MIFEKIVQTGICTLLQIPCESVVVFSKNPSPKAIMHGILPVTESVAELLQFEKIVQTGMINKIRAYATRRMGTGSSEALKGLLLFLCTWASE